jgi:transposase, IS5 family
MVRDLRMSQMSFGDAEYRGKRKQTRREIFLAEMEQVVPWNWLLSLIEPFYPVAGRGRHPYPIATMLRVHLMQNWFGLSDPAMEEALYENAPMRQFARLTLTKAIPDETTILNFRRLLETNELAPEILARVNAYLTRKGLLLKRGSIVDATIIAAPSSTKNQDQSRDPEMHQTKKGNQWHFGMKAHIGVDADSGLVHTVTTTPANEADIEQAEELLHGKEEVVHADAGYTGADKRVMRKNLRWEIAAKRGKVQMMKEGHAKRAVEKIEKRKASIRARVEHPFRVIKRQFGYVKVRFRGLVKNTAQVLTLFALSNLWMARRKLLAMTGVLRPQFAK